MKSAEQIKARLEELRAKLLATTRQQPDASFTHEQIMVAIHRLQGNIGSLEWALRNDISY